MKSNDYRLPSNGRTKRVISIMHLFRNVFVLIIAAGLFVALMTGCATDRTKPSLNVGDMKQQAEAREQEQITHVRVDQTDDMVRMYRGGLIFEDFSEEKKEMDRAFEAYLEKKLHEVTQAPLFVKSDMEYYNDSLKKVRDENWGIEQILADGQSGIREGHYMVYVFAEDFKMREVDNVLRQHKGYMGILPYQGYTSMFHISAKALTVKTLDEWRENADIPYSLKPWYVTYSEPLVDSSVVVPTELKEKYSEEFVFLYDTKRSKHAFNVCAPKRDLSLKFETQRSGLSHTEDIAYDKYLTVLAQKYMGEAVQRIIEEEGLADSMAQLVIPGGLRWEDTDLTPYDTGSIKTAEDELKFLNEGYKGDYDVNLIYLKTEEEAIDYAKIQAVVKRAKKLITEEGVPEKTKLEFRMTFFVTFYNMSTEDRTVVRELFKRNPTPENYFRDRTTLSTMYDSFNLTREETDGFHYMDIYGTIAETPLAIYGYPEELSSEGFAKRYKER